jgi:cellulose synthase/poly-beta-1,6-N-acetylglucosamine synthase-like glycosyltransferase
MLNYRDGVWPNTITDVLPTRKSHSGGFIYVLPVAVGHAILVPDDCRYGAVPLYRFRHRDQDKWKREIDRKLMSLHTYQIQQLFLGESGSGKAKSMKVALFGANISDDTAFLDPDLVPGNDRSESPYPLVPPTRSSNSLHVDKVVPPTRSMSIW